MPKQRSSVEVFKALAQELGIKALADLHAESVRDRDPPPRLVARLLRDDGRTVLTPKQREIMVMLVSGYRRQEIAEELGVTLETVKTHLQHAYIKMGVHRQIEAINAFLEEEA